MRRLALHALPIVCLFVSVAACGTGPAPGACTATTCAGCCDATGQCRSPSPQACGQLGNLCAACAPGSTCQFGACIPQSTCTPTSCVAAGKNCGTIADGCGGVLQCGQCDVAGESCGGSGTANVCGPGTCMPKTCASAGASCGSLSDGCGALLDCGTCTIAGDSCGGGGMANVCGHGACVPKTCGQLGKNCGPVSDGCTGQLDCGACTIAGDTCGGGGMANVCGHGACVAKTCQQLQATCGMIDDGCGNTLTCGTCAGFETCGGGGTANACGAMCIGTCPAGFTCSAGVCGGGSLTGLVLDVLVPPQHAVTGSVRVNGLTPATCSTGSLQYISFTHATDGRYNTRIAYSCYSVTTAWSYSVQLYPGTYKVTVERDNNTTPLPDWDTVVNPAFVVNGPQSGVVLDVMVPPQHAVTGSVRVNGLTPATCSTGSLQYISFTHATDGRYSTRIAYSCYSVTTAWSYTVQLYPGTYKVTVERDNNTTPLPDWDTVVNPAFVVNGPQSGVVLDVLVPPQHAVTGSVRVNGLTPATCSTGSLQYISFTHATDGRYSTRIAYSCYSVTTAWSYSVQLYPGTYKVTVERDNNTTPLPDWDTVVNPAFVVNGPQSGVVLDVLVPPQHAVTGSVRVNGLTPATCSTGSLQYISFTHATDGRYSTRIAYSCYSVTTAWSYSVQLYPGTYKVTVERDNNTTPLPDWDTVVNPAFVVNGPQSGVVLDVLVPPQHAVTGSVRVNGLTPATCSTGSLQYISFTHATDGRYSTRIAYSCYSVTTAWSFSVQLYPGTYQVTVERDNNTTPLPDWDTVVNPAFVVNGPQSGVVLDVLVPPQRSVTGSVRVNGLTPATCSTGSLQYISFTHATDGRYSTRIAYSCYSVTTAWSFSVQLYPGTYKVTVERDNNTTPLPDWDTVVVERLLIP